MAGLNTQGAYFDNVASTAAASAGVSPGHWRVYTKADGVFAIDSTSAEYKLNSLPEAMAYTDAASGALQLQIDAFTGGVTGMTAYTNATPVPAPLGGVKVGDTFSNASVQQMFDRLLYPYMYPAITAFTISGQSSPLEVGDSIAANPTFTWSTSNSANITGDNIAIFDQTASATIASGLANDGSEATTYAAITRTSEGNNVFRVEATNTLSETISRTYTVNWVWRVYSGESVAAGPLVEADIEALGTSALAGGFAGTYSFAAGGYKYIAYPAVYGTATQFKDQMTNFNVAMQAPYTVSVTNTFGQTTSYNVHRTTNVLGSSINIVVA
jgi:hypothetical protein